MNGLSNWIKAAVAAVGTAATYMFGGWDTLLQVLVVFVVLDYLSGIYAAWHEKRLNSYIGARGIARKIALFIIVALAHLLDGVIGLQDPLLRTLAIWFYIANEGLSIVENLAKADVPVPGPIRDALALLKGKAEGTK